MAFMTLCVLPRRTLTSQAEDMASLCVHAKTKY